MPSALLLLAPIYGGESSSAAAMVVAAAADSELEIELVSRLGFVIFAGTERHGVGGIYGVVFVAEGKRNGANREIFASLVRYREEIVFFLESSVARG